MTSQLDSVYYRSTASLRHQPKNSQAPSDVIGTTSQKMHSSRYEREMTGDQQLKKSSADHRRGSWQSMLINNNNNNNKNGSFCSEASRPPPSVSVNRDRSSEVVTVQLVKGLAGFGFGLAENEDGQIVKHISDPDRCGKLKVNDRLISIDGLNIEDLSHRDVVALLKRTPMDSVVTITFCRDIQTIEHGPTSRLASEPSTQASHDWNASYSNTTSTSGGIVYRSSYEKESTAKISSQEFLQPNQIKAHKYSQPNLSNIQPQSLPFNSQTQSATLTLPTQRHRPVNSRTAHAVRPQTSTSSSLFFSGTPDFVPASAYQSARSKNSDFTRLSSLPSDFQTKDQRSCFTATQKDLTHTEHRPKSAFVEQTNSAESENCITVYRHHQHHQHHPGTELNDADNSSVRPDNSTPPLVPRQASVHNISDLNRKNQNSLTIVNTPAPKQPEVQQNQPYVFKTDTKSNFQPVIPSAITQKRNIKEKTKKQYSSGGESSNFEIADFYDGKDNSTYSASPILDADPTRNAGNSSVLVDQPQPRRLGTFFAGSLDRRRDSTTPRYRPRPVSAYESRQNGIHSSKEHQYSVELYRGSRGFGFSIRGGKEFARMPISVLTVMPGGAADRDGQLKKDDQVIEINGHSTTEMTHDRATELIRDSPSPIRLTLYRAQTQLIKTAGVRPGALRQNLLVQVSSLDDQYVTR